MKIIQLKAENFKRLKAVDITPKDDVVIISGANEQGKTSVLDAIWAVLNGADMAKGTGTEKPIRDGQTNAEVTLDVGEFILKRRWTAKGSTLTVTGKDNAKHASPQKIIDSFMAAYTIDPVALCNAKPAELKNFLLNFIAFDFAKYTADRKRVFDSRTIANRDAETAGKVLASMPLVPNVPGKEVSATEILEKIRALQVVHDQNKDIRFEHQQAIEARDSVAKAYVAVESKRMELADLQEKLRVEQEGRKKDLASADEMVKAAAEMVEGIVDPDPSALQKDLENIETTNRHVRGNIAHAQKAEELRKQREIADGLTAKIKALDETKDAAFKATNLPVEGLTVTEESVLFKGIPFAQCSSEEKLRVSVGLAMMSNPKLKVLRIKDASLLDKKHMGVLTDMVREKGFQAWIEKVDETGDVGFYIEDGEVKNAAQ